MQLLTEPCDQIASKLETHYCDYNAVNIQALAVALFTEYMSDQEKAVKAFSWVRDNIKYRLGFWSRTASETLEELEGTCSNKANLLVALLRSQRIPAGYGVMEVLGKKYFGPGYTWWGQTHTSKATTHVYACVKIGNRWFRVDPCDDPEIIKAVSSFSYNEPNLSREHNFPYQVVVWDGENDAMIPLRSDHILQDDCVKLCIDHVLAKQFSTRLKPVVFHFINCTMRDLRKEKKPLMSRYDTIINAIKLIFIRDRGVIPRLFYYLAFPSRAIR